MRIKNSLTLILSLIAVQTQAQTIMNIHLNNGSITEIPLSDIDSMTYTIVNPGNPAILTTATVSSISTVSAISGGDITDDGGTSITNRGICWNTSPNPTTANFITDEGLGTGPFVSNLSGLAMNTTYYVRAYAINSFGISYGNELSFTTTDVISTPGAGVTFDGYTYSTIVLGNGQEWFSENLRTSVFSNGDPIPNIVDDNTWIQTTSAAWSVQDPNYELLYGKSYNGFTVIDNRNACPVGWHTATLADFEFLTNYLGSDPGSLMKSEVWTGDPNTNLSGFSALPGGIRTQNSGTTTIFNEVGNCAVFHTNDGGNNQPNLTKWIMCLSNNQNGFFGDGILIGASVRCVKD